ncbi:hypothetical protein [Streptomyces sp. NPDC046805]
MPSDPYAVLRALVRAEALRSTPKTEANKKKPQQQPVKRERG